MRLTGSRSTKKTEIATGSASALRCLPDRLAAAVDWFRCIRRPGLLPGLALPARPGLLILTMILLVGICAALANWGARTRTDRAEFLLLAGDSSPNLNNTSAETLASPSAPVPQTESDKNNQGEARFPSQVQPVSAPVPEPPVPRAEIPVAKSVAAVPEPPAVTVPPPVPELPQDPPRPLGKVETVPILRTNAGTVPAKKLSATRDPHLGDDPMMRTRTCNVFGLKTLLAAMLAASPSLAEKTSGPPSQSEKLDEIQKQLDEIKKPLADVPKAVATLARVEKELKDLRTEYLAGLQQGQSQLSDLKKQIDQLRADVEWLRNRDTSVTRSSHFPPIESPPTAATGRVEIRNDYPAEVIVTVNRRAYPVPPGETVRSEPIPAGAFTYEVLGVTPPRTRTVISGKTFQVHVHPQR